MYIGHIIKLYFGNGVDKIELKSNCTRNSFPIGKLIIHNCKF